MQSITRQNGKCLMFSSTMLQSLMQASDCFGFTANPQRIGQCDSPLEHLGLGWITQESDRTLLDLIRR